MTPLHMLQGATIKIRPFRIVRKSAGSPRGFIFPFGHQRSRFHPPLPGHLMVRVVVTADAEAKQLAGGVLNLEPLDLEGALEEPVAGLEVPVAAPQEVHAADGEEVSRGQPLQERLEFVWATEEVMD